MTRVVVSPISVSSFPEGGGHFWVFLQWIRGLQRNGCEVFWLECLEPKYQRPVTDATVATFLRHVDSVGMADHVVVYRERPDGDVEFVNVGQDAGLQLLASADLLVNFKYDLSAAVLDRCRRRVLIDIDPGLLQFWLAHGQLGLLPHDHYFTTGARIAPSVSAGRTIEWHEINPVVDTVSWSFDDGPRGDAFTTVTNWFGEWLTDGAGLLLDNSKRVEFLRMLDLPSRTPEALELAVCFGDGAADHIDRAMLVDNGWRVRHAFEVASTPLAYQSYIRGSRGEFSCVKPSCLMFRNGWLSDRTLCYLASGRPCVIQHTGPSEAVDGTDGLLRFSTVDGAAEALAEVGRRYDHHCRAARELAVAHFDSAGVTAQVLAIAGAAHVPADRVSADGRRAR